MVKSLEQAVEELAAAKQNWHEAKLEAEAAGAEYARMLSDQNRFCPAECMEISARNTKAHDAVKRWPGICADLRKTAQDLLDLVTEPHTGEG